MSKGQTRRSSPSRSMSSIRSIPECAHTRICRPSSAIRLPISSAITKTWNQANGSTSRAGRMPRRPPLSLTPQSPAPRVESWTAQLWRRSIGALRQSEETAMAKGILIAAMDFSNVAEDEFNDWYDTEHIPERQRVPGFLVCQRWIGAENPKQSVATYDLEGVSVLQGPGYRAIGGENLSPWSKRVTARVQRLVRFEGDQILPGDKASPENAGGLLLVGMTPAAAVETAFNAWYETEHVPALARVPGVLCARRFRTAGGSPKYVALYHLASPAVVDGAEWKQASGSTPMPEHIRPQISDRLRLVCRNYRRQA